ncbi:MAG: gliding motility-associated C-terminal domain-containing protein [Saprospiraceae bacterium]
MKNIISILPKIILTSIFALFLFNVSQATHNRAGEITFRQLNNLTFEITITTYTKASSVQADRDSLELCFGDSSCEWVQRNNGPGNKGEVLGNDIKKNIYTTVHAYGSQGTYTLNMNDPNRNGGILNVNPPYSDQVPFHLSTTLTVLNIAFSGQNTSPILSNPPIDEGCVDQRFEHNPGAFDVEGDSLAYELIVPLQSAGTPVSNYFFPNNIGGGVQILTLDPITGTLVWDSPQEAGEYNIAFVIREYRNGVLISTTIRDMQITIETCNNRPPVIDQIEEICVVAGETVNFNVIAEDPDVGQNVTLTAIGGPLDASFSGAATFTDVVGNPVGSTFNWNTECQHIQDQYYQILFKAEDNYFLPNGTPQHLVDYMTVRIRVIGPPPENVQAEVESGEIEITWDGNYLCKDSDNFFGFSVWRREGSNPFPLDTCDPGLDGRGYVSIADKITSTDVNGRFTYLDTDVERGRFYCYRIVGDFAEFTPSGEPFNLSEGLPSEEVCVQMSRDLPLMTNVSVDVTGLGNGEMYVRWSKPSPDDLDTIQNPGPYEYRLFRSDDLNGGNPQLINTSTAAMFWEMNDTIFTDTGLNTENTPYSYFVEFFSGGNSLGETSVASQIYLNVVGTDQKNILTWEENIPWEHFDYTIYRENTGTGAFDSIGTTTATIYEDLNLENGKEYCYYVRGIGTYNIPEVVHPLVNFSQEFCAIPVDTVPPCAPEVMVMNRCNDQNFQGNDFENDLIWTNPNDTCANDVTQYNVYYAENTSAAFSIIETNEGATNVTTTHLLDNSIAGCYYVTALDSVGNESVASNVVCVDNCPEYTLPNVFTPNGDGNNELFVPFPYLYISRIDMTIVDRWGTVVFQTENPDINWDGKNLQGKDVPEGTYFYKCLVFENRVEGEVLSQTVLSGYIQVIRGK